MTTPAAAPESALHPDTGINEVKHTYLPDTEGRTALHRKLDRRLNVGSLERRAAETGHAEGRRHVEVANLLVELVDGVVARDPGAEDLFMHHAEALEGEAVFPSVN